MKTKIRIPKDFPVRPLRAGAPAKDKATCGACGLSWDDAIGTTWTPVPSGRCPFEYFHVDEPEPIRYPSDTVGIAKLILKKLPKVIALDEQHEAALQLNGLEVDVIANALIDIINKGA